MFLVLDRDIPWRPLRTSLSRDGDKSMSRANARNEYDALRVIRRCNSLFKNAAKFSFFQDDASKLLIFFLANLLQMFTGHR